MNRVEHARLLLLKAAGDEIAMRHLAAAPDVPDAVVGFHAQQAAEKMLKAVLASRDVDFPRTHDLRLLVDLLDQATLTLPPTLVDLIALQPYAVQFRYDLVGDCEPTLDRATTLRRLAALREWCERLVEGESVA